METDTNKNKKQLKLAILFFALFILFISFWFWGKFICLDIDHNFICGPFVFIPLLFLSTIFGIIFSLIGFNFLHKYIKNNK